MIEEPVTRPLIGRILTRSERAGRMADESAPLIEDEVLRSAFAISPNSVVTAWHCVRTEAASEELWFRVRYARAGARVYAYVPIRLTNYDEQYDVAVLCADPARLADAGLSPTRVSDLLAAVAIPLSIDVRVHDEVQVMGFPESATSSDSDTNAAVVVDTAQAIGEVSGLKLYAAALGTISPVSPHGLSGGPVLASSRVHGAQPHAAVAIVRAAPTGTQPGLAAGAGLIATRIEDVEHLPEIAVALHSTHGTRASPLLLSLTRGLNVAAVLTRCGNVLHNSLVEVSDRHGKLVGWPHFLNEPWPNSRPTAVGTAYGLKLASILDEHDHGLNRAALAQTLWNLRRPDGGWAARTGVGAGRPEISALVLGALASGGCWTADLAAGYEALENSLAQGQDLAARERTYVVCAILRGLARGHRAGARMTQLRAALLAGAIKDQARGNLMCWSNRLSDPGSQTRTPSAPHTAIAVVSLVRANRILGGDDLSMTAIDQATRWLAAHRSLEDQTEQIRRYVGEDMQWDTLTVRHFTAAWAARALLLAPASESPEADILLIDSVRRIWNTYRDGYWEWNDDERPIWMAYQAACVLREFASRTSASL